MNLEGEVRKDHSRTRVEELIRAHERTADVYQNEKKSERTIKDVKGWGGFVAELGEIWVLPWKDKWR